MKSQEKQERDNIYYNNSDIISYNRILSFVIGIRGVGKTFSFKGTCIDKFIKKQEQFVWVRRYKNEVKLLDNFFGDIAYKYPNHKFRVDGRKCYIDGKVAGYFIPLAIASEYKSVPFPNVTTIVFDEFIITDSNLQYLENEPVKFLDLFSTIARLRNNVNAYFIANNVRVNNPYFAYFNIYPNLNVRFTKNENIVIETTAKEEFKDTAKQTRFGKLISGTVYGDYAIENSYLLDNYNFVEPLPKNSIYQLTLAHNGKYFGVYFNFDTNLVYITKRSNLNGGLAIAITKDDIDTDVILAKSQYIKDIIRTIKECFANSKCRYESIKVKSAFYDIMRELNFK